MDKKEKLIKKLEKAYEASEGKPLDQARILKRGEKLLKKK